MQEAEGDDNLQKETPDKENRKKEPSKKRLGSIIS